MLIVVEANMEDEMDKNDMEAKGQVSIDPNAKGNEEKQ